MTQSMQSPCCPGHHLYNCKWQVQSIRPLQPWELGEVDIRSEIEFYGSVLQEEWFRIPLHPPHTMASM